ncbi:hypothetical protein [Sulfurimonas sp.]|uniref:hypothetical protein n=1 Tax=Sulfurimonas sp. TaxID=2022749 RepID=UPI0019EAD974|nr:hypothetical protein [Sulfurimonas sp.]MBE0514487.1 hypothetical protein [Sulfurimonas sp.]
MSRLKIIGSVVVAMAVFAGCAAKEPTKGDFMRMHAADQKEIAEDWDKGSALKQSGEKLVKHGEKLIKSGEKDIATGKEEIEKGNQEIIEGTRLSDESERIFHEKYPELRLETIK